MRPSPIKLEDGWLSLAPLLPPIGMSSFRPHLSPRTGRGACRPKSGGCNPHIRSFFYKGHCLGEKSWTSRWSQKNWALLVATLFFLVSLLINLLQRRYGKTRLGRMLRKEESIVNFLEGIHKNLGKIEVTCTLEVQGASSPQEVGKTIHVVRNEIQSTIANMQEHLRLFSSASTERKSTGKTEKSGGEITSKIVRMMNHTKNGMRLYDRVIAEVPWGNDVACCQ